MLQHTTVLANERRKREDKLPRDTSEGCKLPRSRILTPQYADTHSQVKYIEHSTSLVDTLDTRSAHSFG